MCIPGYWLAGFHTPAAPRKLQIPLGWGTLGYAFPAALGAALAGRGPVVAISGDGGFLYARGELATVAQERIPLTAVIVDDGGYGMLRYDQDVSGAERYGVDLHTPDFVALARAFGIRAEPVDGLDDEFGEALPSTCSTRADACSWPDARAARAAAEHVAELVPPPPLRPARRCSRSGSPRTTWRERLPAAPSERRRRCRRGSRTSPRGLARRGGARRASADADRSALHRGTPRRGGGEPRGVTSAVPTARWRRPTTPPAVRDRPVEPGRDESSVDT